MAAMLWTLAEAEESDGGGGGGNETGSGAGDYLGDMTYEYFYDTNTSMNDSSGLGGGGLMMGRRPMNITADLDIRYALPLYGYIMPFLVIVTLVANTLIVLVLSKKHMRTPTNLVLMAMALSDMFTLLFPAPWFLYLYTFGNHGSPLGTLAACYAYHVMHEGIPGLFHTASIWLTLALAIQRYIYVCHPPLARTWCTMQRVKKAIVWIYVLAMLHQFPRLFDKAFTPVEIEWEGNNVTTCGMEDADWVYNYIGLDVYYNVYFWFRVLCVHLGPCASLVVLNALLFGALRRAQQKRDKLFKENRKASECRKLRDSNCTTLMLIVVVSCFLAVEIPLAVVTVLHIFDSSLKLQMLNYYAINAVVVFINFFISLSYPINFAIYCGMSRQFRETFQGLFSPGAASAAASRPPPSSMSAVGLAAGTANTAGPSGITIREQRVGGSGQQNQRTAMTDCTYTAVTTTLNGITTATETGV